MLSITLPCVLVVADAWAAVGGVGSMLAVAAAVAAIWFAKMTVDEAPASGEDDQRAQEELLASHGAQLEAFTAAHREEVA